MSACTCSNLLHFGYHAAAWRQDARGSLRAAARTRTTRAERGAHRTAQAQARRSRQRPAAAGSSTATATAAQGARQRLGLGVVELEGLGAQGLQVGQLVAGFQFGLVLGVELFLGRDQQHIAVLAHPQALALQDDVQRLVPGHIL
jgi:hypothetical protein